MRGILLALAGCAGLIACCLPPVSAPALTALPGRPCLAPLPDGVDLEVRDVRLRHGVYTPAPTQAVPNPVSIDTATFEACVAVRDPRVMSTVHLNGTFLSANNLALGCVASGTPPVPRVCADGQEWVGIPVVANPVPGMPPHVVMAAFEVDLPAGFVPMAAGSVVQVLARPCGDASCTPVPTAWVTTGVPGRLMEAAESAQRVWPAAGGRGDKDQVSLGTLVGQRPP